MFTIPVMEYLSFVFLLFHAPITMLTIYALKLAKQKTKEKGIWSLPVLTETRTSMHLGIVAIMQISCVDIKFAMWCPDSIFNRRVKPWSRFLPNFTSSIYRPGEQTIVSCSNWIRTLVAMANYSCHWLVMGKVEIGIYCCLTADMLIKNLQKCSLSSLLPNIWILSKPLNLIGCHGNRNIKFAKKIFKNHLLRSHKGDEAETLQKCS